MKLYSGGFAQFFLGHWQDAEGEAVAGVAEEDDATPEEVRRYFEAFRGHLSADLGEDSPVTLAWSEALDGPHDVVDVSEQEFGALLTVAARAAVADKRLNPISRQMDWHQDPAVVVIQDADGDYLPVHHLVKADCWLPADFMAIFETEVPERDLILGSLPQLAAALREMDRILNTPNEVTRKLASPLLTEARAAHAALTRLVAWATANGMPILIEP